MSTEKSIPKNHYIDNARFLKELSIHLKEYKRAKRLGEELPRCPEYIGKCFKDIADGIGKLKSYAGYSFLEEMKSDAIINCLEYYHNFDPKNYNNPFGYFSQYVRWAFHRRIAYEQKKQYIKYKIAANSGILDEDLTDSEGNVINSPGTFDNILEFIDTYEAKMEERKAAKKKDVKVKDDRRKESRTSRTSGRPSKKRAG
jgi:hypothetical protein